MKRILYFFSLVTLCSAVFFHAPVLVRATGLSIVGSDSLSTTVNVALPITDVQISGTSGADVPVKLFVTSGTLQMSTTTGLTFTGGTSGSTLYFSGSLANVNAALATLTYTRSSTGTDTLEVSLVNPGEVFFTGNNHLYKFISGNINWNDANTAAQGLTAYGATGYLATITSQQENDFVSGRLTGDGWIGGSDAAVEGAWRWVTGPEAGTQFWSGTAGGSTVGGNYAHWNGGEPNQSGDEDCAETYVSSGSWNDLPCSATVSGYVVEFGTPGTLPTVVAKNVSITTTDTPVVNSLSPVDNAIGIGLNSNLVMAFSRTVTAGTGNILLKRTSDNATIETIGVTSGLVTGGGTSTITINPNSTLAESTEYYVLVPNTAFKDGSNNFYAGIASTTAWSFTTGDFTAPSITSVNPVPASTTATISWTTSELASTRVSYGANSSYGLNTVLADTSPRVLSHTATLSSLAPCTTYHYQALSADASGNSASSPDATFMTGGCVVSTPPTTVVENTITVSAGGTTTAAQNNATLTVTTPSNFTSASSSVVIQVQALVGSGVLSSIGLPSTNAYTVGTVVFDVKAIVNSTTVLDSFDAPVTITQHYTDADVASLAESTLRLYHYHNGAWLPLDNCTVNVSANTVTCTAPSLSIFALFGQPGGGISLPAEAFNPIAAPSQGFGVTINSGASATTSPSVTLSFTPGPDTTALAISNTADFARAGIEPLSATKSWTLEPGNGTKTVYVKFYNKWGKSSDAVSSTILLAATVAAPTPGVPAAQVALFKKDLKSGMVNADVLRLQQFLNAQGTVVAEAGPGAPGSETTKFSAATKAALIKYQEAHAAEILAPLGLTKGTGFFGVSTRKYVNSVLAK